MKRKLYLSLLAFALAVALFGPVVAFAADASACYTINGADARAYCLAKAHKEPGRCYSIVDADKRAMCLAEVRR